LAETGTPPNGINFDILDKGSNNKLQNYGSSKAASWMLSREFARRYGKDGIISTCLNPGYLKTKSFNGTHPVMMFFMNLLVLHDPKYGAYTELYAGLSPDLTLENNGSYIYPWSRIRPNSTFPRQDIIKAGAPMEEGGLGYGVKLWSWCEEEWKKFV
jgi:hypothetical protein